MHCRLPASRTVILEWQNSFSVWVIYSAAKQLHCEELTADYKSINIWKTVFGCSDMFFCQLPEVNWQQAWYVNLADLKTTNSNKKLYAQAVTWPGWIFGMYIDILLRCWFSWICLPVFSFICWTFVTFNYSGFGLRGCFHTCRVCVGFCWFVCLRFVWPEVKMRFKFSCVNNFLFLYIKKQWSTRQINVFNIDKNLSWCC